MLDHFGNNATHDTNICSIFSIAHGIYPIPSSPPHHACSHARTHATHTFLLVVKRTKQLLRSELNFCVIDTQTFASENHTHTHTSSQNIHIHILFQIYGLYALAANIP